jgi:cytidine deaminase
MDTNTKIELPHEIKELSRAAWDAREMAYVLGPTKVGCAVLGGDGRIYSGCNVEHRLRSHDVHAEVNAITSMVAAGCRSIVHIFVAAERDRFTPCGACMDWIMQFGSPETVVSFQGRRDGPIEEFCAGQLMPYYPS